MICIRLTLLILAWASGRVLMSNPAYGSVKIVLKTSIVICVYVLKNNRTMREPKSLQKGLERQLSSSAIFWAVVGSTGSLGWFLHARLQAAAASMG